MIWLSETQKFGVAFTAGGVFFFFFGIIMFFDRPLLALGNILFIFGLYLIIGPNKAYSFFTRPTKIRGTIFFVIGILLILLKWSIIGFIIEIVGILGLFGDFFGIIVGFLKSVPYLGPILTNRFIEPYIDKLAGITSQSVLPV